MTIPSSSNFYLQLRGPRSARDISELYRDAGWVVRKCGWEEFEICNRFAELVLEGAPVVLHGAVSQPGVNVDAVLQPLVEQGIEFSSECYAADGGLIFQRDSG